MEQPGEEAVSEDCMALATLGTGVNNSMESTMDTGCAAVRCTKHAAANWHQTHLNTMAVALESERPVLQPHAAVPVPPPVPEFRQVRRAPLCRYDFEQFGCADSWLGRVYHKSEWAVDHSEQCRCRMEALLATTST